MPQKIGALDVDGHNFPNLPLMKLSAWHKQKGDKFEMWMPKNHYDIVYKSKVFTYTPDVGHDVKADLVIEGGTGYSGFKELSPEIEMQMTDYSLYPKYNEAYGFLTRGCPNNCPFA